MLPFIFLIFSTFSYLSAQYFSPCLPSDYKCITYFLSENSDCTTGVYHTVPSPVTILNRDYEIPYLNSTFTNQYSNTKNIGQCYVTTFKFNLTSNVLILSIECPNLEYEANTRISYHRPRQQDLTYVTKINAQYKNVRFTANLMPGDDIDLCNAVVSTYLTEQPVYRFTPRDQPLANFIKNNLRTALNQDIYAREFFEHKARMVFKLFVNSILCDFRCPNGY